MVFYIWSCSKKIWYFKKCLYDLTLFYFLIKPAGLSCFQSFLPVFPIIQIANKLVRNDWLSNKLLCRGLVLNIFPKGKTSLINNRRKEHAKVKPCSCVLMRKLLLSNICAKNPTLDKRIQSFQTAGFFVFLSYSHAHLWFLLMNFVTAGQMIWRTKWLTFVLALINILLLRNDGQ